jgi:MIP family channel proteins
MGEFLSTMLFLFMTITTVSFTVYDSDGADTTSVRFTIAQAFGFSIMALVYIFASVSGAHVNPSVTTSLVLMNRCSVTRGFFYMGAQAIGAIVGTGLAKGVSGDAYDSLGKGAVNELADGVSVGRGFTGEMIMTFLLCITVLAASDAEVTKKFNHNSAILPFAIGMAVYLGHLVLIPITNCSINPARSLGTSVVSGDWPNHSWIFYIATETGAVLSAIIWKSLGPKPEVKPRLTHQESVEVN